MRAGEDAAEGVHHDGHDVCERGAGLGAIDTGYEEVREGAGEEECGPDDEEGEGAPGMDGVGVFGVAVEADGVEPYQETQNSRDLAMISVYLHHRYAKAYRVPCELHNNIGEDESLPGVGLGLALAGLV